MTPEPITIRACRSQHDYRACQEAQRRAWGITEDGYVVPIATMVGAQLHGGLVLGAFLPDGEAVGLSFAFLGRIEGRLGLYSQLTGVVPGYQGQGLGERLKQAQREAARAAGLEVIAWAFDPLQAGNAHFNLARLGATCGRYLVDMYGVRTDSLNAGVPTDRLIAEWETAERERVPIDEAVALQAHRLIVVRSGEPEADSRLATGREPRLLLEVPEGIVAMRQQHPDRARRWLEAIRAAFTTAFGNGYRATGFVRQQGAEGRRDFYVLERAEPGLTGR